VYNPDSGKLETVAKVASGFTEEEMVSLRGMLEKLRIPKPPENLDYRIEVDYWVEPGYVVEVAFDDITESPNHTCSMQEGKGLALRFPRMMRMRGDKDIREITTSGEVRRMFEIERAKS
jgi:DNA ligase-1